jgi:hypothetical protein
MQEADEFSPFAGASAAQDKREMELPMARVDKEWSGGHNEKASLYA